MALHFTNSVAKLGKTYRAYLRTKGTDVDSDDGKKALITKLSYRAFDLRDSKAGAKIINALTGIAPDVDSAIDAMPIEQKEKDRLVFCWETFLAGALGVIFSKSAQNEYVRTNSDLPKPPEGMATGGAVEIEED